MAVFCASAAEAHNPVGDKLARRFEQLDHNLEELHSLAQLP
jgi:hypothetical protein